MKKDISKIIKMGILAIPIIFNECKFKMDWMYFDKGEIYEKVYEPARTYEDYYIIEGISIPYTEYDDEDYIIKIRKWDERNKIYHTLNLEISKEQYDTLEVCDTVNLTVPIKYPYPYIKK